MSDDPFPAACTGSDVHFPDMQARTTVGREKAAAQREEALALCSACPIQVGCLAYSLDGQEPWGIWGGMEEEERRRLIDAARAARGESPLYVPGISRGPAPPDPVEVARAAETAEQDDEWADVA